MSLIKNFHTPLLDIMFVDSTSIAMDIQYNLNCRGCLGVKQDTISALVTRLHDTEGAAVLDSGVLARRTPSFRLHGWREGPVLQASERYLLAVVVNTTDVRS